MCEGMYVCIYVHAWVCVCVCVRACVRACAFAYAQVLMSYTRFYKYEHRILSKYYTL